VKEKHVREMSLKKDAESASPSDLVQYNELLLKTIRVLDRLPEKCGRIFYMNRFEGMKYTEIAEKLSVSVKTVEANMGKALREFRKALAEQ
jgi:RNA polymerase sigma-70 factor (ECF subfamily)